MEDLAPGNPNFVPPTDPRRPMGVPPPVRILSVADVSVPYMPDPAVDRALAILYLTVLQFDPFDPAEPVLRPKYDETFARPRSPAERLPDKVVPPTPAVLPPIFRAENFLLRYTPVPALDPGHLKLIQLEVPSLDLIAKRLLDRQLPYERIRGLLPGLLHLHLSDPAGHALQVFESRNLPL